MILRFTWSEPNFTASIGCSTKLCVPGIITRVRKTPTPVQQVAICLIVQYDIYDIMFGPGGATNGDGARCKRLRYSQKTTAYRVRRET